MSSSPPTSRENVPIDALAPTVDGRYEDPYITVTAAHARPPRHRHTVRTST
jgi:hypothetical protein